MGSNAASNRRARGVLALLALALLALAVTAAPALAVPAKLTVTNVEPDYTSLRVEGIFEAPTAGLANAGWQISTDGVNWEGRQEYNRFGGEPPLEVEETFESYGLSGSRIKPGTHYWVRLAGSEGGPGYSNEIFSEPVEVTTPSVSVPEVLSVDGATDVGYGTAHASGVVERGAGADAINDAECRFEYVTQAQFEAAGFEGAGQTPCDVNPVTATGPTAVSADIDGLSAGTTYHLRLVAANAGGLDAEEADDTFTTLPMDPPEVLDVDVPVIGYTVVEATGEVDRPAGADPEFDVDCRFEYAPTWQWEFAGFSQATQVPCDPNPLTDAGANVVSAEITGLSTGTEYHLRLTVSSPGGTDSEEVAPFTTLVPGEPGVAIDAAANVTATTAQLSGDINPGSDDPGFNVNWHFECEPACQSSGGSIAADNASHDVAETLTGLEPNTEYEVKLVASNAGSTASAGPIFFTTLPAGPAVTTMPGYALGGGTGALVGGYVDANSSPTTFWVEYGPTAAYGSAIPAGQDASAGSGPQPVFVTQQLAGLAPLTTYHYRLVAGNAHGTVAGEDQTFTTPAANALAQGIGKLKLPDNRVWEKVSPEDKNNGDAWKNAAVAAVDGNRILWKSQASFAGQPTSRGGQLTDYLSTRGATKWNTQGIAPPGGRFNFNSGYQRFSEDLAIGLLSRTETEGDAPIDPEHPNSSQGPGNHFHYFLRTVDGRFQMILGEEEPAFAGQLVESSGDMSHLLFQSTEELAPNDVCKGGRKTNLPVCLYDRVNGTYVLVSVLPDETATAFDAGAVNLPGVVLMSKDASHVYFSAGGTWYTRVDRTHTEEVGKSERTTPATYEGFSTKLIAIDTVAGRRALLLTNNQLVDADENASYDAYLWDETKPVGSRLTLISEGDLGDGEVLGIAGEGAELRDVYFVSQAQILSGDPTPEGPKLYAWSDRSGLPQLDYVGPLDFDSYHWEGDHRHWGTMRISPNGRYLAIKTPARMTAYDNGGQKEMYLYDSAEDQLECATCDPTGAPTSTEPTYDAIIEDQVVKVEQRLRNVSDNGQLFFQSEEGLVPKDSNQIQDVYEYSDHSPFLISSGLGRFKARFFDASASGSDVFFSTTDQLLGWDKDGNTDVYDARVNGGMPEPPLGSTECEGDACQPAPNPPLDPTPSSANFNGAGNVKPPASKKPKKRCKKLNKQGKKKKRCGKRRAGKHSKKKRG